MDSISDLDQLKVVGKLRQVAETIKGGFENPCEAHSLEHEIKKIQIDERPFFIFDWELYANTKGYCPADDEVSKAITVNGGWELGISEVVDEILTSDYSYGPHQKAVIDIGAHIGWYTRKALDANYPTLAVEATDDTYRVLEMNATESYRSSLFVGCRSWISGMSKSYNEDLQIRLLKIDIEGNETWAVKCFQHQFNNHQIDYAVIEISPVFNDTYESLINDLIGCGYRAWELTKLPSEKEWKRKDIKQRLKDVPQTDLLFVAPGQPIPKIAK